MPRWSVAKDLIWTRYDDSNDWVVYNPASADVHLLTASAQRLWTLISERPSSSTDTLVVNLAADLDRAVDADLERAVNEAVAFMDGVGLIRPSAA